MDNVEVYKKLQDTVRRLELEINSDETKIREMEKTNLVFIFVLRMQ